MEKSQPKAKILDKTVVALFLGAILVGAVLSIAVLSSPADASRNAYRYPPYSTGKSIPNNTCVNALYAIYCAVRSDSTGQARVYSKSSANSWIVATVEHNCCPLQSNPSITVTTPNFVDVKFTNSVHGKFYIADNNNYASAILKTGFWTTVLRQADQVWIKDTFYAKEYNGLYLPDGEYIIPYTNVAKTLSKNNNPGTYGIQTYFEARTYGSHPPNITSVGEVDAYTSSKSYTLYSDRLAVECALCT